MANSSYQEVRRDSSALLQTNKGYKEEQDLVVLQGAAQPHQSHQEQEDANADDPGHHTDAGDQAEPLPPGGHSNQQQTHQLSRKGEKKR